MKRLSVAITVILFSLLSGNAQDMKGIHFVQGLNWKQVLARAKEENKYIFVDCYATWCAPCKAMDKNVYTLENVGDYMNGKFISVKVQMDTSKQDNEFVRNWYVDASTVQQQYKVIAFPTYVFLAPDGHIVHKAVAYKSPEDFVALVKDAVTPNKQYYTLLEKFQEGKLDTSLMNRLARVANELGEKDLAIKVANEYINQVNESELFTSSTIFLMYDFTKTSKDRGFGIFLNHADEVYHAANKITPKHSKTIVEKIINNEEIKPFARTNNGKPDWERIEKNIKRYGPIGDSAYMIFKPGMIFNEEIAPALKIDADWTKIYSLIKKAHKGNGCGAYSDEFVVGSSIIYYLNAINSGKEKDCQNFVAAAKIYDKEFPSFVRQNTLNDWAWFLFNNSSKSRELKTALSWSKRSMALVNADQTLSDGYRSANVDTYANVLYKLGRNDEAIEWEQKAVNLNPKDKSMAETLDKMGKGLPTWPVK